ncbi:MAG: calcium-binding protein [Pseudomonadota bacterium]
MFATGIEASSGVKAKFLEYNVPLESIRIDGNAITIVVGANAARNIFTYPLDQVGNLLVADLISKGVPPDMAETLAGVIDGALTGFEHIDDLVNFVGNYVNPELGQQKNFTAKFDDVDHTRFGITSRGSETIAATIQSYDSAGVEYIFERESPDEMTATAAVQDYLDRLANSPDPGFSEAGFSSLDYYLSEFEYYRLVSTRETTDAGAITNGVDPDDYQTLYGNDLNVSGGAGNDVFFTDYDSSGVVYGLGGDDIISGANLDDVIEGGNGNDSLAGREGADRLLGEAGADILNGGDGDDELDGGDGDDDLTGGTGIDILRGGDGDDTIDAGSGNDTVWGGRGSNAVFLGAGADQYYGSDQTELGYFDIVYGDDGADIIQGGDGFDVFSGDAGDDTLSGGGGDDTLTGGAGMDRFVFASGDGADTITDFTLTDDLIEIDGFVIDPADLPAGVLATADGSDVILTYGGGDTILIQGGDIADWNSFTGGAGDDTLVGTELADVISGNGGNDTISGNGGDDTLSGGDGNDSISGGDGFDEIDGGAGEDEIFGGAGNDRIWGGSHYDVINAGAGDDEVWGDNGQDTVDLGDGDDIFHDNDQSNQHAHDTVDGGAGNDTINGGGGNDTFRGGDGNDTITGGAGDDTLEGGLGDDHLDGGVGNDTIRIGNTGRVPEVDTALGGSGDDLFLAGGYGEGTVDGGDGLDTLSFVDSQYGINVNGAAAIANPGYQTGFNYTSIERIVGSQYADDFNGGAGGEVFDGGAGDDTLNGGGGNDTLTGGQGADVFEFTANGGNDTITDFGTGSDQYGSSLDMIDLRVNGLDHIDDVGVTYAGGDTILDYGSGTIRLVGVGQGDIDLSWDVQFFYEEPYY